MPAAGRARGRRHRHEGRRPAPPAQARSSPDGGQVGADGSCPCASTPGSRPTRSSPDCRAHREWPRRRRPPDGLELLLPLARRPELLATAVDLFALAGTAGGAAYDGWVALCALDNRTRLASRDAQPKPPIAVWASISRCSPEDRLDRRVSIDQSGDGPPKSSRKALLLSFVSIPSVPPRPIDRGIPRTNDRSPQRSRAQGQPSNGRSCLVQVELRLFTSYVGTYPAI